MNRIHKSMEGIRASQTLKAHTLRYLERQYRRRSRPVWRRGPSCILAAAVSLFLLLGLGWRNVYSVPTSYISMDVNPSIELGINRFGRVVTTEAYNEDGQDTLLRISLKNKPYVQAVDTLLRDEGYRKYLTENATLYFTIISDRAEAMQEELDSLDEGKPYSIRTYTSDSYCMEVAHQYEMSFGKYRACQELTDLDQNVTMEDCHDMSMGEIQDRIEGCRSHGGTENDGGGNGDGGNGGHNGHHGGHHSK